MNSITNYRTVKAAALFAMALGLSACATGQHIEPHRDVACFNRAAVSLGEALVFAGEAREALIVDAEYNCQEELGCVTGSPGGYDVTYFDAGRLERVNVCPVTGAVRPPLERNALESITSLGFLFDWPESEMRRGAPGLASASVSIANAVAIAEREGGAKAMAIHLKQESGKTFYAVELVREGTIHLALVDPMDGRFTE